MSRLWNNHMHTAFSGDSEAPMRDMIEQSMRDGLMGITLTDHLDIDYYSQPGFFDLDIDSYRKCYKELTVNGIYKSPDIGSAGALGNEAASDNTASSSIEVLWGIELGLQPHLSEKLNEIISSYNFDYVIGSSHQVDKMDPYYPEYFEKLGVKGGVRRYFTSIIENIDAYKNFDAYGHLDYIIRYSDEAKSVTYDDYKDIVLEILQLLIDNDKALEINTGAYKFGLAEPNPSIQIIKDYKKMGGKLITIGSDAHNPSQTYIGYDKLPNILRECGFNSYYVYKGRKPYEYKL